MRSLCGQLMVVVAIVPFLSTVTSLASESTDLSSLSYASFPKRQPHEAAIVEWGNSAVISALDAAVASFGPQTSRGAFFEVETTPVLADPIDGSVPIRNKEDWEGNMVVATNSDPDKSAVELALQVQAAGGAALMIVNVSGKKRDDYSDNMDDEEQNSHSSGSGNDPDSDVIYSVKAQKGEEEQAQKVDIPVIMVSLASANLLTQAVGEGEDASLPERVRLYAAADRPFFEDLSTQPLVYLIHNALTHQECDELIKMASGKTTTMTMTMDGIDAGSIKSNILEGYNKMKPNSIKNTERMYLWKGLPMKGPVLKAIDERLESISGYTRDHFSDFQINKMTKGGRHDLHYDQMPPGAPQPALTFTMFLNDPHDAAAHATGHLVFPDTKGQPIKVTPRKGMAVVHQSIIFTDKHNTGTLDPLSHYAELEFQQDSHKWVAKRWIYLQPLSPTRRIVLPIWALPFGGKLPSLFFILHDELVHRFGYADGGMYFDKIVMAVSVLIAFTLASWIVNSIQKGVFGEKQGKGPDKHTGKVTNKQEGKSMQKGGLKVAKLSNVKKNA